MYPEYAQSTAPHRTPLRRCSRSELLLTNGGDDALRVFFDAFVDADSRILICRAHVSDVPLLRRNRRRANRNVCRYDPQHSNSRLTKSLPPLAQKSARALHLANPNNPTGTLVAPRRCERILRAASRYRRGDRRSLRGIFRPLTIAPWIRNYPQSLRRAHVFKSRRSRRTSARRRHRAPRLRSPFFAARCRRSR